MITPKDKYYLCQLILKFKDQTITPQELELLDRTFQQHPETLELLTQIIEIHTQLNRTGGNAQLGDSALIREDNEILSDTLWQTLANEEKTAEIVKFQSHAAELPHPSEQEIPHEKECIKTRKGPLLTIVISMAALILLLVSVRYLPVPSGIEVATLADNMKARWNMPPVSTEKGSRLVTGYTPLSLREGIVELVFDNHAKVIIEAPAEFCLLTEDQIKLNYGKLYAVVPQTAIGFSVNTPNSRIIDLGTEFGVNAYPDGSTELHVIKGKINLLAGTNNKVSMEVSQGYAKRVSASTSQVNDIPVKKTEFARAINTKNDSVWRGENKIDLADIVGGGDGSGNGQLEMGIDPVSGKPSAAITDNQTSANDYHPVPSNPYIDGVFIPNGLSKQIISSEGHIFQECPISSGGWYINILNAIRILESQTTPDVTISGSPAAHCVLMHANMGITYDLEAMRSHLPQANIVRFQSKFGIGKEMDRPCNADFWILVDGKVRYKKTHVQEKTLFSADIELSEKDRFLTLITTDGQDPEGRILNNTPLTPHDSDWCFFADPVLIAE